MLSMRRALYLTGAAAAMSAALWLLITTGLPQRAAFTGQIIPGQRPIAPELNALAPDFERPDVNGNPIRLSDLRGAPVVVNFWATWCGPCIVEMPILQSIFEARQDTGLRILAVNLGESASVVRAWGEAQGLTYDLLLDEQQQVAALYYLRGQPSTYVISREGVITAIFFGPISESGLLAALN